MNEPPRHPGRLRGGRRLLALVLGALGLLGGVVRGDGETLDVAGLEQAVEILRDRWGIAHIYARTEHDLFFAQGFNAARDRLFQLELWRRQATGTMAEIRGRDALPGDIGARLLSFRGDLARELAHYHPRGSAIVGAFVEGINAYVALTEREPDRLPLPFRVLGIKPGRWTPEVVVSRHNGLFRNATQEVQYARLVHLLGSDQTRELLNLHPGHPAMTLDPKVDPTILSGEVLKLYAASRAPVRFRPEDVQPEYRGAMAPAEENDEEPLSMLLRSLDNAPDLWGSNNWAVAARRTLSGHPFLANDPHRSLQVPSLRYWVHLVGPGWDVIGGGEPALPGVSIGHNTRGAWGLTIFPIDQEDLYVYETNPDDPSQYRYRDAWESMRVVRETFAVKGQDATTATLKYTRHGPVIHEDPEHHTAYALRAGWLEIGTAPYLASLRMDQAASWEAFREACRYSLMPSENMVWADVEGHIGWQPVGLAPLRRGWDGLLPVPGDGRYEWDGILPVSALPHRSDPPEGWIATANQDNLPPGYPHTVGFSWADPFRHARIAEVLGSGRRLALMDMMQLQQDELSIPARLLVPLLRPLEPPDDRTRAAIQRLTSWDFVMARDSVAAALYATWEKHLKASIHERLLPEAARSILPSRSLSTENLVHWLTSPDPRLGDDPVAARDALLLDALGRALAELEKRFGPEMDRWKYGQPAFKHVRLRHPLGAAVNDATRARLDLGPLPRGGLGTTVNNTSDSDNQVSGATFRLLAVVGDWDRSLGTNAPGQSGNPSSPHYADLFRPWSDGRYFPVLSTRAAVEPVTQTRLHLQPEAK